jgi:pimeloyl-ACP methyl ester carboxylesterase
MTSVSQQHRSILRRIGMGGLILGVSGIVFISALPVLLLFFGTAVPPWLALALIGVDIALVATLLRRRCSLPWRSGALLGVVLVAALAVSASQHFATTPPITDADGHVVPGSIATLEPVELNGSQQWMTIRGHSTDKPVLLFLAGGPGGSELVMTRRYLSALEQHFVVVNWDQPGTGKSYGAADFDTLTPGQFLSDAHELTLYLRERFDEDKIYVLGESWGSILGIWLVQQHPDLFHAFISTGQMVDPVENDTLGYEFAIERLTEQGRMDEAEQLRRNGPPPYTTDEILGKFWAINGVLNGYMQAHAHGEGVHHNLLFDSLGAPEYGLLDKAHWVRGLIDVFTTVYPQLNDVDLRTQATELAVPVYFIKGRWDVNAVNSLTEEYFALLDAPHKELIWFEDSAHTPLWDEPEHFTEVLVTNVLEDTYPQMAERNDR